MDIKLKWHWITWRRLATGAGICLLILYGVFYVKTRVWLPHGTFIQRHAFGIEHISGKLDHLKTTWWARPIVERDLDYTWLEKGRVIAHGLGSKEASQVMNTGNGFSTAYDAGCRIFEADMVFTKDDVLVCLHDWNDTPGQLTREGFIKYRKTKGESLLTLEELLKIMSRHKDAFLVTDTKDHIEKSFLEIVETASRIDRSILDRIVPQIYKELDLKTIEKIHPFKSYIYTLYRVYLPNAQVVRFCRLNRIKVVTMPEFRFQPGFVRELHESGVSVFVHTVNSQEKAKQFIEKGAWGVYSDILVPNDFTDGDGP